MTTITVSLPDSLQPFIDAQVTAGGYSNPGAYLAALVLEAQLRQERSKIDAKLLVGIEELDRGEGRPMKPEDWTPAGGRQGSIRAAVMTLPVNWSPTAEQDRDELVRFFRGRSPEVAIRFIDATEQACQRLSDFPYIGGTWESDNPGLAGIRVWPVPGFKNYLLFYRVADRCIEMVRFLYGGRDLESLLRR